MGMYRQSTSWETTWTSLNLSRCLYATLSLIFLDSSHSSLFPSYHCPSVYGLSQDFRLAALHVSIRNCLDTVLAYSKTFWLVMAVLPELFYLIACDFGMWSDERYSDSQSTNQPRSLHQTPPGQGNQCLSSWDRLHAFSAE